MNKGTIFKNKELGIKVDLNTDYIITASTSSHDKKIQLFCTVISGMYISDAAFYGAKTTLEKLDQHPNSIFLVNHDPVLKACDNFLKDIFYNNNFKEKGRFEPKALIEWKKQDTLIQRGIISDLLDNFFSDNEAYQKQSALVSVNTCSIEVNLSPYIEPVDYQTTLVELEIYLRNHLGDFPIILTMRELSDANTRRQ